MLAELGWGIVLVYGALLVCIAVEIIFPRGY